MTGRTDNDFTPMFRIGLSNWAIIISLIVALVGWGVTTRANTAALEKKADKETVEVQLKNMAEDLQEIKADVREIRHNQDKVRVELIDRQTRDDKQRKDKIPITNEEEIE